MNKTLNINIYQDPTKHIEKFLHEWQQIGSFENTSDLEYKLFSHDEKQSNMSVSQEVITISGDIPSQSFMLIDALSKACEADKVIEGEFVDKDQPQKQQNPFADGANFEIPAGMNQLIKISSLSKFKLIALLVIALPLLLIAIPIMIIVMIIKIVRFKLKF